LVINLTRSFIAFTEQHAHKNAWAISETVNMLVIAQKKPTDHICKNKDILANINLDLKLLYNCFTGRPRLVDLVHKHACFESKSVNDVAPMGLWKNFKRTRNQKVVASTLNSTTIFSMDKKLKQQHRPAQLKFCHPIDLFYCQPAKAIVTSINQ